MSGIGNDDASNISAADGVTTVFPFSAFAYDTSQIKVYSVVDDIETEITTGFTITINNDNIGGNVTFLVAPASGQDILRRREVPYTQTTEFSDITRYKETAIEKALNTLAMQIQQVYAIAKRAIKYGEGSNATDAIVGSPVDGKALIFDGVTGRLVPGPDAADIAGAQGYAADALSSKNAAAVSETNAANSATIAQNAVDGMLYRDVVFITSANSPYAITNSQRGKMIAIDTSGGNVIINLATIATLTAPFTIGFKKTTNDGNTVTINRGGTDVFDDGSTSLTISSVTGVNITADTDTSPDQWLSASFGSTSANITVDKFAGNAVLTAFSLTTAPGSDNNCEVFISGVRQTPGADYSVSGTTLTFTSAPPAPVSGVTHNIVVRYGSVGQINAPAPTSVQWSTLAASLIASVSDITNGVVNKLVDAVTLKAWIETKTPIVLQTVTANGSSPNLDLTAFNPAKYRDYQIRISDAKPSTAALFQLRVSSDGGSSFISLTNYLTRAYLGYQTTGSPGSSYVRAGSGAQANLSDTANIGTGSVGKITSIIDVFNPDAAEPTLMHFKTSGAFGSEQAHAYGDAVYNANTQVNAIRIFLSTGNWQAGSTAQLIGIPK